MGGSKGNVVGKNTNKDRHNAWYYREHPQASCHGSLSDDTLAPSYGLDEIRHYHSTQHFFGQALRPEDLTNDP